MLSRRSLCWLALLALMLARCSILKPGLTPAQQTYLNNAKATPLDIVIPQGELPKAWANARDFVRKYSPLPLIQSDEAEIRTRDPAPDGIDVGWEIHVRPATLGSVGIVINPLVTERGYGGNAESRGQHNAHLLAYYLKTGQLEPALVQ